LRLGVDLPPKAAVVKQRPSISSSGVEVRTSDLPLSEAKMSEVRLNGSKAAGLRLTESQAGDSPDSSILSVSRRSLTLGGKSNSFLKQQVKNADDDDGEEEEKENEKEVEERLGRLLGLATTTPTAVRYSSYTVSWNF
jgi:hypothetical protein